MSEAQPTAPSSHRKTFQRRFLIQRWLSLSLFAGAAYDIVFAALMVFAPGLPAKLLNVPVPQEEFYLWLMAVFLLMLAFLYISAALDPRRYSAIIVAAIVGRTLGAVAFVAAAWGRPDLGGLYPLAAADLVFAAAHALLWLPLRRS